MKLAIPATSPDLDAPAEPRFGRCAFFIVVDTDTFDHEVVENTAAQEASGAGIAAANLVIDAGAQAVIAGNLGPKATQALVARGLSLYRSLDGSVRDQIEGYMGGQLQPLSAPSAGEKFGMGGGGRGRGGGGRGQGGGGRGPGGGGRGPGGGGRGQGGGGRGRGGGGGRGPGGGGRGPGGGGRGQGGQGG